MRQQVPDGDITLAPLEIREVLGDAVVEPQFALLEQLQADERLGLAEREELGRFLTGKTLKLAEAEVADGFVSSRVGREGTRRGSRRDCPGCGMPLIYVPESGRLACVNGACSLGS